MYFIFDEVQDRKIKSLAEKYNNISINFETSNKTNIKNQLIEIIKKKDKTYSTLALYFIIDNEIQASNEEINQYFDIQPEGNWENKIILKEIKSPPETIILELKKSEKKKTNHFLTIKFNWI